MTVTAASLNIDGGTSRTLTAIASSAEAGSSGNAGPVFVTTTGATTISSSGEIQSDTFASGNAGDVTVKAGSLSINGYAETYTTGVSSSADPGSSGNPGQVSVTTTGATTLSSGGEIQSDTSALGNAGDVSVTAGSLSINGGTSANATGIFSDANSDSTGNAGRVTVTTGSVSINGGTSPALVGIFTDASGTGGSAGTVSVTVAGAADISSGGDISSDTFTSASAGGVSLTAGSLSINGGASIYDTGISSDTEGSPSANAGRVTVTTGSLSINGGTSTALVGIFTDAGDFSGTGGAAGTVSVTVAGAATLSNGGSISSDTFTSGNAGDVSLTAGSLSINGGASPDFTGISSDTNGSSTANAGRVTVTVTTGSLSINGGTSPGLVGISSQSGDINSTGGSAGTVSVTVAGAVTLVSGGEILSDTYTSGNAGDVILTAGSLSINGVASQDFTGISSTADSGSSGNAGRISVATTGATTISGSGEIESDTYGPGNAGDVILTAGSLSIDGAGSTYFTGISSDADVGSTGASGVVTVHVSDTAFLVNGGEISSTAYSGSGGQPGTITISAGTLVLGTTGLISIENDATVPDPTVINPTRINIQAGNIAMTGGQISAASSGNIDASSIDISYGRFLYMDPSTISTSSQDGNGGPITITGQGPLWLENSNITTSVRGATNGNGGDIRIDVPFVVFDTGVIQANTAAPQASGGNVTIDALALVPSFQSFQLGGNTVTFDSGLAGLNVVQAAAPDGLNGTLSVTVPTLDLGNSLLGLTGAPSTPPALGRSPCGFSQGNSLSIAGQGGLPVSARDALWVNTDESAPTVDRQTVSTSGAVAVMACR